MYVINILCDIVITGVTTSSTMALFFVFPVLKKRKFISAIQYNSKENVIILVNWPIQGSASSYCCLNEHKTT